MRKIGIIICILLVLGNLSRSGSETGAFEGEWPTVALTGEVCPVPGMYIDIPEDYWAKEPIENLTKVRIMEGFRDFTFRPERILTRAELAVLIVRADEMKLEPMEEGMFWDVRSNSWPAPYIAAVVREGYMIGYPDRAFRPQQIVTRAEAAITLARAFDLFEEKCETGVFPDIPKDHWACDAIDACKNAGLLEYLGNKNFEPTAGLTRAEASEIFSRIPIVRKKIEEIFCVE
jgi:hypothetical protein